MKCATKQARTSIKAPQSSTNDTGGRQGSRNSGGSNTGGGDDGLLAGIVRNGSPRIIASLLASASRCGDTHDWTEMNEYQQLAYQLTEQGGLQRFLTGNTGTLTQTAAAGAGGGSSGGSVGGGT